MKRLDAGKDGFLWCLCVTLACGAFLISFLNIDQAENQPTRLHPSIISCKQKILHYSSPPDRWGVVDINSSVSFSETAFKLVP